MEDDIVPVTDILQLPDPCLLAVLQCMADDPRSLCSAARAHSRLHQAAVLSLSSVRAVAKRQQQADSLVQYLGKYGQHVRSCDLKGAIKTGTRPQVSLLQLPHSNLHRLVRLELTGVNVQLQLGQGFPGILQAAGAPPQLKQLRIHHCRLLDGVEGLAAALRQLPDLEHLSIRNVFVINFGDAVYPASALQPLRHLTHLELDTHLQGPDPPDRPQALQHCLQSMTRLQDLQLYGLPPTIHAGLLSGLQHLTRLGLSSRSGVVMCGPGVLAGRQQLQHLALWTIRMADSQAVSQLLQHLQEMQQLTYLAVGETLGHCVAPAAAAYSALTASSKLRYLDMRYAVLPAGTWAHIFPAATMRLPHLQELNIPGVRAASGGPLPVPEGSRLASCCPALRVLNMQGSACSSELLGPLVGLSGLQELGVSELAVSDNREPAGASGGHELQAVGWLTATGLRQLTLPHNSPGDAPLLRLAGLKHLTCLRYDGRGATYFGSLVFKSKAPGDEPVWRQVLRYLLNSRDPDLAQQAAAAYLAE